MHKQWVSSFIAECSKFDLVFKIGAKNWEKILLIVR